ncbi:glycosyl transferase [Testicularia cyperi]|uniref:Glycosyl transferase n=1 Tax=Testicularia cyperi TaxID=1882483 RepID=A0A317XRD2_9BASI|nr:glycosyl transferase [Testicularia cyperi]
MLGLSNRLLRIFAFAFAALVALHYIGTTTSPSYQAQVDTLRSSLSKTSTSYGGDHTRPVSSTSIGTISPKANATFYVLCREKELNDILHSIFQLETTFNDKPQNRYPYVFLNEVPFSDAFKLRIQRAVSGTAEFGLIPPEMWNIPPHIDIERAHKAWKKAKSQGMPYGGSASYRMMCRFNSGRFYDHPLMQQYEYYWRVEPGVRFYCDLGDFDPFRFMQHNNKKYGWTIALHEIPGTVTTLWINVRNWYQKYPHFLAQNNLWRFVTDDNGRGYNKCHWWSNFEIASMSWMRGEAYRSFFNHLDEVGGFFYERWGDAPVHSIGASLLLDKSEFHYFDNIGYYHPPMIHCPKPKPGNQLAANGRSTCYCAHESSFDFEDNGNSCLPKYLEIMGINATEAKANFMRTDDI